jgi:hypothetical protein
MCATSTENYFSVFKRMKGVYRHCGEAHLHRYLAEFDFLYNRRTALGWNDKDRVNDIARGIGASALPIGGLVKPRTNRQKARKAARLLKRARQAKR